MLETRIQRKEASKITLLCDSTKCRGLPLLKSFMVSHNVCADHVIAVLLESVKKDLENLLPAGNMIEVRDPHGWLGTASPDLYQQLNSAVMPLQEKKVTVFIDSLTTLILMRSVPYTCQLLHKISSIGKDVEVVGVLHEDCHDLSVSTLLQHCASTVIRLQPGPMTNTLHKKPSGKVIRKREQYRLAADFTLQEASEITSVAEHLPSQPESTAPDPTANLTFNLSLSDKEKADRKQVPLPYMHQTAPQSESSGKIFYQPDEADDFDEEDPDDDLDI